MGLTHAGAVAFRRNKGALEYLLVSSSSGSSWVLPKGHIEAGERPEGAALRELVEEAGVHGKIVAPLAVRRFQKSGKAVVIQYYLVEMTTAGVATEERTVRWHAEDEAAKLLSFPHAQDALREAAAKLEGLAVV